MSPKGVAIASGGTIGSYVLYSAFNNVKPTTFEQLDIEITDDGSTQTTDGVVCKQTKKITIKKLENINYHLCDTITGAEEINKATIKKSKVLSPNSVFTTRSTANYATTKGAENTSPSSAFYLFHPKTSEQNKKIISFIDNSQSMGDNEIKNFIVKIEKFRQEAQYIPVHLKLKKRLEHLKTLLGNNNISVTNGSKDDTITKIEHLIKTANKAHKYMNETIYKLESFFGEDETLPIVESINPKEILEARIKQIKDISTKDSSISSDQSSKLSTTGVKLQAFITEGQNTEDLSKVFIEHIDTLILKINNDQQTQK